MTRQLSHLGKSLILAGSLQRITSAQPIDKKKAVRISFLLIDLFHITHQMHESMHRELDADGKVLKKRIVHGMDHKGAYADVVRRLFSTADQHFKTVKKHAVLAKKRQPKAMHPAVMHSFEKANKIYKLLKSPKLRAEIRNILLKKLDVVYSRMLSHQELLLHNIVDILSDLERGKRAGLSKRIPSLRKLVAVQCAELQHFAICYTNKIVHSEPFFDRSKNKVILATKKL